MIERGRFLVFEGLDGAGSTTQTRLIWEWLGDLGIPALVTFEPTTLSVGQQIRDMLKREPWPDGASWAEYMALLFAADRTAHLFEPERGIGAALYRGEWAVCDRYLISSLAYQSSEEVPESWVLGINRAAARVRPDVTVFIDTPVNLCMERIAQRNTGAPGTAKDDVFHDPERLGQISARYTELLGDADIAGYVVAVDGSQSVERVCESIKDGLIIWSR